MTQEARIPKHKASVSGSRIWKAAANYLGLFGVLIALVAVFSSLSDHFLSVRTLTTIANQVPDLTVVAVGMTLVLVIGGIDLSVGSVVALCAAVVGVAMVDWDCSFWTASVLALLVGAMCGFVNGSISVLAGIPSFIVTLGMLEAARGGAYLVAHSETKYIGSAVESFGAPLPAMNVSPAFLVSAGVVLLGQLVLSRTIFGRYLVASGSNEPALRMSGIDSRPHRIAVFVISGLLCGLAGIMQTSRLSSADPNAGVGLELGAIAAAVIGGTSLMGGRGSVINTLFGVLIISVLQSGLASVGATDPIKRLITGTVIVAAVLLDAWRNRLNTGLASTIKRALQRVVRR